MVEKLVEILDLLKDMENLVGFGIKQGNAGLVDSAFKTLVIVDGKLAKAIAKLEKVIEEMQRGEDDQV